MARPDLGPPPESAPPSQMQRGIQALAFVATACELAAARDEPELSALTAPASPVAGAYCVLIYDWRPANLPADAPTPPHIFTPVSHLSYRFPSALLCNLHTFVRSYTGQEQVLQLVERLDDALRE